MAPLKKSLNASDFKGALEQLDYEMGKHIFLIDFAPIDVVTVGGFLAVTYFNNREATADLDYMITPEWAHDDEIMVSLRVAIREVAEKHHLKHEWMNDGLEKWATPESIRTIFARAYEQNVLLYNGTSLRVWAAPLEWALERKLRRIAYAERGHKKVDMVDALALFKHFRDLNEGPVDMEYFETQDLNGSDMLPTPFHMEQSSAEASSTASTAQASTTRSLALLEVTVRSKDSRDGPTTYRYSIVDGAKDIEVKEQDWVYNKTAHQGPGHGYYSYTGNSGTTYHPWTLEVQGKGRGEARSD